MYYNCYLIIINSLYRCSGGRWWPGRNK